MTEEVNKLYEWVNQRYNQYLEGEINEEEYTHDLSEYKKKLAESQENIEKYVQAETSTRTPKDKINPNKVRSTSIAGLRKKLLDEMKK